MTVIRLFAVDANGRRHFVRQEHGTETGKKLIERAAFDEMSKPSVDYCTTERDDSTFGSVNQRGNGRYR